MFDHAGSVLRSLNLGSQTSLKILLSNDHQQKVLLLKVPKEYDLVSPPIVMALVYTCRYRLPLEIKDKNVKNRCLNLIKVKVCEALQWLHQIQIHNGSFCIHQPITSLLCSLSCHTRCCSLKTKASEQSW